VAALAWSAPIVLAATTLAAVDDPGSKWTDERFSSFRPATGAATIATQESTISAAERQALVDLYAATLGGRWERNTNWVQPAGTECSWYGVTCDADGTTVVGLVLDENNLVGSLPASLGSLTALRELSLRYNHLAGPIPAQLGSLTNLQRLNLYGNRLTGPIPAELENLTNLKVLDLGFNPLTGQIPAWLGTLSRLQELDLNLNDLTGPIPVELADLTDLQVLQLLGNALSGPVPPELGELTALRDLELFGNQLGGTIPPELGGLTALRDLELYHNQLSGPIPPELGNLSNLETLLLGHNRLTGNIPPELRGLANLQWLDLSHNQLIGSIPAGLADLPGLRTLWLGWNRLSGSIPSEIGTFPALRQLDLTSNQLAGPIPPELGNLAGLRALALGSNRLTGQVPESITRLTSLRREWADLRWNGLSSSDPAVVAFLNAKQVGSDWQSTQTVAVGDLTVTGTTAFSVTLAWTPIAYQEGGGGYEILSGPVGGPHISAGVIDDKSGDGFTVTGLEPGTTACFVVRSFTSPHADNPNTVVSDPSAEVCATTPAALEILTHSPLHRGVVAEAYSFTLSATCTFAPCGNWLVIAGSLPPGLHLEPVSGELCGVPTTEGSYAFVVQVSDAVGATTTKAFVQPVYPEGFSAVPTLGGGGLMLLTLLLAAAGVIALRRHTRR